MQTNWVCILVKQLVRYSVPSKNVDILWKQILIYLFMGKELNKLKPLHVSRCHYWWRYRTFNIHVDNVINKINRSLGVLKCTSPFVPPSNPITLYNSFVLPRFDYCCTLWDACSETQITRLQNRGMIIVRDVITEPMF